MKAPIGICLLLAAQQSCFSDKNQTPSLQSRTNGRFVPVSPGPDIALDTQTGQICRTWDWENVEGHPKPTTWHTTGRYRYKFGSARESEQARILSGFAEYHEFGF